MIAFFNWLCMLYERIVNGRGKISEEKKENMQRVANLSRVFKDDMLHYLKRTHGCTDENFQLKKLAKSLDIGPHNDFHRGVDSKIGGGYSRNAIRILDTEKDTPAILFTFEFGEDSPHAWRTDTLCETNMLIRLDKDEIVSIEIAIEAGSDKCAPPEDMKRYFSMAANAWKPIIENGWPDETAV